MPLQTTRLLLLGMLPSIALGVRCQDTPLQPLGIVAEFQGHIERVRVQKDGTTMLTMFVGPLHQVIRRGDAVRLPSIDDAATVVTATVVNDSRAASDSGRIHLRVQLEDKEAIARLAAAAAEHCPGFPPLGLTRDKFVVEHGPQARISARFEPQNGDELAAFVRVGATGSSKPASDVRRAPTHCSFTLQFGTPIDPSTLSTVCLLTSDAKAEVPLRALAVDSTNTRFRFEPPLGLTFTDEMRRTTRDHPERPHYHLRIPGGDAGLKGIKGERLAGPLEIPITIDPDSATNLVGWRVFPGR